jgi:hypothetical protein
MRPCGVPGGMVLRCNFLGGTVLRRKCNVSGGIVLRCRSCNVSGGIVLRCGLLATFCSAPKMQDKSVLEVCVFATTLLGFCVILFPEFTSELPAEAILAKRDPIGFMEAHRDKTFLPCRHYVCCWACSTKQSTCPICREQVVHSVHKQSSSFSDTRGHTPQST